MFIMKHFKHRILPSILSANFNEKFTSYNGRKMAKIISGKEISDQMKTELKKEIQDWVESTNQRKPQLTCVLVGNNPSSATYVQNKMKAAELVGIDSKTINLDENISEKDLIEKLNLLNNDDTVDGILVQLPLPASINERTICNAVSPEKDVDGFHITNIGKLCLDMKTFIPCTAIGVIEIIKRSGIETFGKNIVVVGRSKNVGLPIAMLLHSDGGHDCGLGMDATVTICHRYTPPEQLQLHCKNADIIISAVGKPGLIKASMVKPGAVLIDVGLTRVQDPDSQTFKLVGDVDFEEVSKIAGAITPVPGGVGPMTVAMLMQNTFLAAKNKCKN